MSSCGCWRQKSNSRRADALANEIIPKNIDLVTLGDYDVGKIIFLTTYYTGKFPHEYLPPVFNTCQVSVNFDGKAYKVNLIDTTGQEDYQKMRSLFYHDRDVFLVCYSVGNRASFENVREKWVPEVIQHSPETPILIVAFNTDLNLTYNSTSYQHSRGVDTRKRGESRVLRGQLQEQHWGKGMHGESGETSC